MGLGLSVRKCNLSLPHCLFIGQNRAPDQPCVLKCDCPVREFNDVKSHTFNPVSQDLVCQALHVIERWELDAHTVTSYQPYQLYLNYYLDKGQGRPFSLAEIFYICLPGTETQSVGYSPWLLSQTSKRYKHQLLSLITTLAFLCMCIWTIVGFPLSVYCGERWKRCCG